MVLQVVNNLEIIPFHVGEIFNDVDDQYFVFITMYSNITNQHVPLNTRNVKSIKSSTFHEFYIEKKMNKARLQHKKSTSLIVQNGKISGHKEM